MHCVIFYTPMYHPSTLVPVTTPVLTPDGLSQLYSVSV